jgi:nucleotide-binding universal stress UspA family protein
VQQILENVERRAEANLREVAERLREQGANAEGRIVLGTPAEQIARFAEDEGCDLIAMSTHGRNLITRGVLGSVTDKVIHSVSVPVLAITPERARKYHQDPSGAMTTLLAPLDGSELAESVLPYAESLALSMSLRVTLVKALRLDNSSSAYLEGMAYATDAKIQLEVEQESAEYLGEVAAALRDKGVQVDTKVILGTPASAIADMAHEHDYDIIAMATHGRSGISRWVLGSVTETLVRTSGNPVLVVPPGG